MPNSNVRYTKLCFPFFKFSNPQVADYKVFQHYFQAHCRTITTSRSISQTTTSFFKTLDMHVSQLGQVVEEAQKVNDQQLSELEHKFEECAMNEERQLLEKVAELLASSNARKKKLVQTAINGLRESASNRTDRLKQEMSTMHDSTSSVKDEWTTYMEKAESYYLEDTVSVENSKKEMEVVLQSCLQKAKMGAQQWNDAQRSLLNLEEVNVASVHEIVRLAHGGLQFKINQFLFLRLG
nr:125 kDa kinesin-related protein-like isoform X1 [Ipomoea batatas]